MAATGTFLTSRGAEVSEGVLRGTKAQNGHGRGEEEGERGRQTQKREREADRHSRE